MKNKVQTSRQVDMKKKTAKAEITENEFRRRLKKIDVWRKEHLAEIRAENPR